MILAIRVKFIGFLSLLTDLSYSSAQTIFIIVVLYIILLFIFTLLDRSFYKKYLKFTKNLISKYDEFFYLLAKKQYKEEIDRESIGGDPCIAAILPVINSNKKSYLQHRAEIKSNIKKVEILLQNQIISESERDEVDDMYRSFRINRMFHKVFSMFLIFITLGIYKLFIQDISNY